MLEDSWLANTDMKDLSSRMEQYIFIFDPLQYSSLYCFAPDVGDPRVWGSLREVFEDGDGPEYCLG